MSIALEYTDKDYERLIIDTAIRSLRQFELVPLFITTKSSESGQAQESISINSDNSYPMITRLKYHNKLSLEAHLTKNKCRMWLYPSTSINIQEIPTNVSVILFGTVPTEWKKTDDPNIYITPTTNQPIIIVENFTNLDYSILITKALRVVPPLAYSLPSNYTAVVHGNYQTQNVFSHRVYGEHKMGDGPVKIKLLCHWASSEHLTKCWIHMLTEKVGRQLVVDNKFPDYWVIINAPPNEQEYFEPSRTIVFRMEPYIDNLPQFNDWLKAYKKSDFFIFLDHEHFRSGSEWWLNYPCETLARPIDKPNPLVLFSAVVSSQYYMPGHKLRINFLKYFQANSLIPVDVFGYDNKHGFKNYQGQLPDRTKDNGIFPYRYHFACENSSIPNYITEKFYDALIGECLLFYWGSPTVSEHIDSRAFIQLDLNDFARSMDIIEKAIINDEHSKRLPYIRKEKQKVLYHFNFWPRVKSLIDSRQVSYYQFVAPEEKGQIVPGISISTVVRGNNLNISDLQKPLARFSQPTVRLSQLGRLFDHLKLWRKCLADNKTICVLDGIAGNNFLDNITCILTSDKDWQMVFLRWDGPPSSNEIESRQLLTPLKEHVMNFPLQSKTSSDTVLFSGHIGSGYLLTPTGAGQLLQIFDKYGFPCLLDEWFLLINQLAQLNTFLFERNIISPIPEPTDNEFKIMRQNANGQCTNETLDINFQEEMPMRNLAFMPVGKN